MKFKNSSYVVYIKFVCPSFSFNASHNFLVNSLCIHLYNNALMQASRLLILDQN